MDVVSLQKTGKTVLLLNFYRRFFDFIEVAVNLNNFQLRGKVARLFFEAREVLSSAYFCYLE